jgi:MFS family permease
MKVGYQAPSYFYGSTLSRVGDEMSVPALLLFGLAVSGSARTAASAYAALTLAGALGGPLLGLVLDRSRRPGAVLTTCLLLYGTGLAVLTLAGRTLPLPAWLAVAAAAGLFGPALPVGWSSQLPRVLPDRPQAYSLDVATYNVAGMAGPACAAGAQRVAHPAPRAAGRFRPLARVPALRGVDGRLVAVVRRGRDAGRGLPAAGGRSLRDPGTASRYGRTAITASLSCRSGVTSRRTGVRAALPSRWGLP